MQGKALSSLYDCHLVLKQQRHDVEMGKEALTDCQTSDSGGIEGFHAALGLWSSSLPFM